MPNKCCVVNCKGNYNVENATTVFKIPPSPERETWIKSLPKRNNELGKPYEYPKNVYICVHHWPEFPHNIPTKKMPGGAVRPSVPPYHFPNVPMSCIPKTSPSPIRLKSDKLENRHLTIFDANDRLNFSNLCDIEAKVKPTFVCCQRSTGKIIVFIFKNVPDSIPSYCGAVTIEEKRGTLSDAVVYALDDQNNKLKIHYCVSPNNQLSRWSQLLEVINVVKNHLKSKQQYLEIALSALKKAKCDDDTDDRLNFLSRQIELNISKQYNQKDYLFAAISFPKIQYFALRNYLILPSERKMRELKSGVTADNLVKTTLSYSTNSCQKVCALLIDEVKIKPRLIYQGHGFFGFAEDDSTKKARSILTIMMRCLHGGKSTVASMTPLYTLNASTLMSKVMSSLTSVSSHGGHVISLITDGLKTNMSFTTLFPGFSSKTPWEIPHPINKSMKLYLLVDSVHICKSLRNNWITEKTKSLSLSFPPKSPGKWKDIVELYKHDRDSVLRLTPLTNAAVFPTPIQRQNVSLVMKVIDDRTIAALERFGGESTASTVELLKLISQWWKTVNVKSLGESTRFNDSNRTAITSIECSAINRLEVMGEQFKHLNCGNGTNRICSLTIDTQEALWRTTMGLAAVAKDLIQNHSFQYVLFGELQQDKLEGEFGCWRQMSGGNYYMTAKDANSAFKLRGLQLLAKLNSVPDAPSSLSCEMCKEDLSEEVMSSLDNLGNRLTQLTEYQISCSVYIAGYLLKCTPELSSDGDLVSDKDAEFVNLVSRGSLIVPTQAIASWVQLSLLFVESQILRCHKQLCEVIEYIAFLYDITPIPPKAACRRLANVLLSGIQKRDFDTSETIARNQKRDTLDTATKQPGSIKISRVSGD